MTRPRLLRLAAIAAFAACGVFAPCAGEDAGNAVDESSSASSQKAPPPSSAVSLTADNFDERTKGKTVFIKFFSPFCEHCKEMAPAWEELAKDWIDHPVGLAGEVNCIEEQRLCRKHGIVGLPTLLYGDPTSDMEQYADGKSAGELRSFAEKTISVPVCSPGNLDGCDNDVRSKLEEYLSMSAEEVGKLVEEAEGKIADAEDEFDRGFKEMQARYDELALEKEIAKARTRDRIRMMRELQK